MRNGLTTWDFWKPARDFTPWFQDIDDLMEGFIMPATPWRKDQTKSFNPACDVEETDSHYLMSFDLPGVSKDDVTIEVVDNQLTVSGERKFAKDSGKSNRHVSERYHGSFKRAFTLPSTIEASRVEASFKDGVLQIAVPKAESARPRQIKISEGKGSFFSKLVGQKNHEEREAHVTGSKDTEFKVS